MDCKEVREALVDFAHDRLERDASFAIQAHLDACPRCRREAAVERLLVSSYEVKPDHHHQVSSDTSDATGVLRVVHTIIQQAIGFGAQEVHIDPQAYGLRVSYHDSTGEMEYSAFPLPAYLCGPVVERFKSMSGIEGDFPGTEQDGRLSVIWDGNPCELLVHVAPAPNGERIIIRIPGRDESSS